MKLSPPVKLSAVFLVGVGVTYGVQSSVNRISNDVAQEIMLTRDGRIDPFQRATQGERPFVEEVARSILFHTRCRVDAGCELKYDSIPWVPPR